MYLLFQKKDSVVLRLLLSKKNFNLLFLYVLFILPIGLFSQKIPPKFIKVTDSIIAIAPTNYIDLNTPLRANRRDTVLMRYFNEAAKQKKYLVGQSYALNQIGVKYRNISNFKKAISLHQLALEAAKEASNIEFEIFSLNMLGVTYRKSDAIKTALDYNQEALQLAESIENPSYGIKRSINVASNSIGNIYQTLEQYDLAIQQFEKSLVLEEELGNLLGQAINHQNIGECYEAQGILKEALERFQLSLRLNEKINSERGVIICTNSIAHVYAHEGKDDLAKDMLEGVLKEALRLDDKEVITAVLINLGWTQIKRKDYKQAKTHLNKALDLAEEYALRSYIAEANKFLSELSVAQNQYKNALRYFKERKRQEDKILNDRNLRYVNDVILRYETEKRNSEFEILALENETVKLRLRKNQTSILIGIIVLVLLAAILYILYRQNLLKNEKKLLTLEQTMLRSQMNPHFLFNSLNSIKLYIINNEKKNAVHYLNKFSKLVRKILEASSLKEISLAEELETVELYMNIENIRFSNEINFQVHLDPDIDPHLIKIPSLILQPFLENSLWHGLSSKGGEKNIWLKVSKEQEQFIQIAIIDNGVGREVAERIRKNKVLKRKSVGIDITKERLANFSRDYQNSFEVEIIDLFDENQQSSGTQINLHIPTI